MKYRLIWGGAWGSSRGHLLRGAVDAAADLAQGIDIQGDDLSVWVMAAQGVHRQRVGFGIAELRGDDGAVADVVIGV